MDEEIVVRFRNVGYDMRKFGEKNNCNTKSYNIYDLVLIQSLKEMNLAGKGSLDKFIPIQYKYATIDERNTGDYRVRYSFEYGYLGDALNNDNESAIDINWAVNGNGNKIDLPSSRSITSAVNPSFLA